MLKTIIRLRRDNDYNYEKIKNTFIPANGEICLVDTARNGLRAVCGDGTTPFGQLGFIGDLIQKGYYRDNNFFSDNLYLNELPKYENVVYIDYNTNSIYHFYDGQFALISEKIPNATAEIAGIMKLYNNEGQNVDGTMTQKAITDKLKQKVEMNLEKEEEMIVFSI